MCQKVFWKINFVVQDGGVAKHVSAIAETFSSPLLQASHYSSLNMSRVVGLKVKVPVCVSWFSVDSWSEHTIRSDTIQMFKKYQTFNEVDHGCILKRESDGMLTSTV